jgi:hypothetical protein
MWYRWTRDLGGNWSDWNSLGGFGTALAAVPAGESGATVFHIGGNGGVFQSSAGDLEGAWSDWTEIRAIGAPLNLG